MRITTELHIADDRTSVKRNIIRQRPHPTDNRQHSSSKSRTAHPSVCDIEPNTLEKGNHMPQLTRLVIATLALSLSVATLASPADGATPAGYPSQPSSA